MSESSPPSDPAGSTDTSITMAEWSESSSAIKSVDFMGSIASRGRVERASVADRPPSRGRRHLVDPATGCQPDARLAVRGRLSPLGRLWGLGPILRRRRADGARRDPFDRGSL